MILSVIPFVATVSAAAAVPFIAAARAWRRRIGTGRNAVDRCANCGREWSTGEHGAVDAWLVEAQLVCAECAPKMRRRTIVAMTAFALATGVSLYFGWGPIVDTISRYGFVDGFLSLSRWAWLMFALPPAIVMCSADWALRAMKKDNMRALESLSRIRLLTPARRPDAAVKLELMANHDTPL